MKANVKYPIRYVASQTGLKPHLIRTWEERYGAVSPRRSGGNRRIYSDHDIRRLKALKWLVSQGHTISAVAGLNDEDLESLAQQTGQTKRGRAPRTEKRPVAEIENKEAPVDCQKIVEAALEAVSQLDSQALERILDDAAVVVPRQLFLQSVITPLFAMIGERWRKGRMKIINEHMASLVARAILWDMLRGSTNPNATPRIVIATPVGHWHEFGALAAALASADSGWHACYYGPNLPAEEIAFAVKKRAAQAVALSLCHTLGESHLASELKLLRRLIGPDIPIFIGGSDTNDLNTLAKSVNAEILADLGGYRTRLESVARALRQKRS